jgi:hypothetical protein
VPAPGYTGRGSGRPRRVLEARQGVATRARRHLGEHEPMPTVKLVDEPVGALAVESDRSQEPPQAAMSGNAQVLGAAGEGDDHVAIDVAERALALAVGISREGALPRRPGWRAPPRRATPGHRPGRPERLTYSRADAGAIEHGAPPALV